MAQCLYEKKSITYPHAERNYNPEDIWSETSTLIRDLETWGLIKKSGQEDEMTCFIKQSVNHVKVTDLQRLLITEKIPSELSK